MIEVIKPGKIKPKHPKITTRCPECGRIFSFIDEEDTYHDRVLCSDFVSCPHCNYSIKVHCTSSLSLANPEDFICEVIENIDYTDYENQNSD